MADATDDDDTGAGDGDGRADGATDGTGDGIAATDVVAIDKRGDDDLEREGRIFVR